MKASFLTRSSVFMIILMSSCVWDEISPVRLPVPDVPEETQNLEASYTETSPNTLTASYWNQADYTVVDVSNIITDRIPDEDGLLNVTDMTGGLSDFNGGQSPQLTLKAAYDDQFIYFLLSWQDLDVNPSRYVWLYNGFQDPEKQDDPAGWTRQRAEDLINVAFEMDNDQLDIWQWSLAVSEPVGYATDYYYDATDTLPDAGTPTYVRNEISQDNRSGPAYEWDGTQQELIRDLSGFTILDPAFYLLNKISFTGDVAQGEAIYQDKCAGCHGPEGLGYGTFYETGVSLRQPGILNRTARSGFDALLDVSTHDGRTYWNSLTDTEKTNLIARIRGFSGVPGYFLQSPSESQLDIKAASSVQLARINTREDNTAGYRLLLVRPLLTGNPDDIQFDPATGEYTYHITLSSADALNRIGATQQILTFIPRP